MDVSLRLFGLTLACRLLAVWGLLFVVSSGALAQRGLKDIPDPDPQKQLASFTTHRDLQVNLFASDPVIAKPIQINFDPQGRLWVASSATYPQIEPGERPNDKIILLEDTNGDGQADKHTVFADGLLIPTAVIPGDGGVYVANSTELLHFRDTDGDGKADQRRVVLSGFGTEDTHHILHTFRWGPNGLLYMNQSIYIHSHIETPWGVKRLNGGGIWRFRPKTMDLRVVARGFVNTWGHAFDRWGQQFATDGAYGDGPNFLFDGAAFVTAVNAPRTIRGLAPGNPKHCGLTIISGRHFPEHWQGVLITNDFRGNRINAFRLTESGSSYAARKLDDVMTSSYVSFRPVDVQMGPDGALYVADWYNPIIQHGEVDFRDPRRDHKHGRIWRITAKDRPLVSAPKLVGEPTQRVLDALKAPEQWTRLMASRVLAERGAEVLPVLERWAASLDAGDANFEHHRLEALWAYQAQNVPEPRLLAACLRSKDHRVRSAATVVLSHWLDRLPTEKAIGDSTALAHLAELVRDDHAQVRLHAVRTLSLIRLPEAASLAMAALDKPMDKYLDYALWLTMRQLEDQWLPAVQRGDQAFGGDVDKLAFALKAVGRSAMGPMVQLVKQGKLAGDQKANVLRMIASLGGPGELRAVWDEVDATPAGATLLNDLIKAAQQRKVKPAGDLSRVADLLTSENGAVRTAAAKAAGVWGVAAARPKLIEMAQGAGKNWRLRQSAMAGLAALGGQASFQVLDDWAANHESVWIRADAAVALLAMNLEAGSKRAAQVLGAMPADANPAGLLRPLLQRQAGPKALAAALAGVQVEPDVAKLAMRAVTGSGGQHGELLSALLKSGGLTQPKRSLSPKEMAEFVAHVAQHGDPARGERIYRQQQLACLKCHAIGGSGGQVGPDMSSLGASAPVDYIIESLLDPNAKVKENYNLVQVFTKDGDVLAGVPIRRTDTALLIRDAEDQAVSIPLSAIDRQIVGKSLMPAGLVDQLTRDELADLVAFLAELGKEGDYKVGADRPIRTWRTMIKTAAAEDLLRHQGIDQAASGAPAIQWTPVYTRVSGDLPRNDLPLIRTFHGGGGVPYYRFAQGRIEVTKAGRIALKVNSPEHLQLWVGGKAVDVKAVTLLKLPAGEHRLTFAMHPDRKADLRCEIVDHDQANGQAQAVGGK